MHMESQSRKLSRNGDQEEADLLDADNYVYSTGQRQGKRFPPTYIRVSADQRQCIHECRLSLLQAIRGGTSIQQAADV